MDLSKRLRSMANHVHDMANCGNVLALRDYTKELLYELCVELEGKVVVAPVTVQLDTDDYVTRFPQVEVHASSPEDSLAEFVQRVAEMEVAK